MENGQDVLVYAPRRYGKSSLVLRAAQRAIRKGVLVGYCDLMRTPTKERFAAALAKTIYSDLETAAGQAIERATPPLPRPPHHADDGGRPDRREPPLRLPRRPAARGHRRHDRGAPRASRPDRRRAQAAGGARLRRVPGDRHARPPVPQPHARGLPGAARGRATSTWAASATSSSGSSTTRTSPSGAARSASRSARSRPPSSPASCASASRRRRRASTTRRSPALLEATGGHPYGTQELAYFLWELVPTGHFARLRDVEAALAQALRSEHNHFAKLWDDAPHAQRLVMLALAEEPTRSLYAAELRRAPRPARQARAPARDRRARRRRRSSAATRAGSIGSSSRSSPTGSAASRRRLACGTSCAVAKGYQPSAGSA